VRFVIAIVSIMALPAAAWAQVDLGDIVGRGQRTPVAVPDFATQPGMEGLGAELAQVVSDDLNFTGMFNLLPRERYPAGFAGFTSDATQINFQAWERTGAEYLVYAYVTLQGDRLVAECRLFDALAGQQVVGKRLEASREWSRLVAHQFADEIVLFLTGTEGIASSRITFSSGTPGQKEIYVADYDGANAKQVTQHGSISIMPRFSPEGNRVAYLSYKDKGAFLYVLDLLSGVSAPLSREVGINLSPGWSPDGNTLALTLSKDANQELYVVNADGSNKRRLTNTPSLEASPSYNPDGTKLAFVSDRLGAGQIFVMNADGSGEPQRISFQGGQSVDPEWSPDGRHIVYVAERRGEGRQLYVAEAANPSNYRRLTHSPGPCESPTWSPDSRYVMYASTRGGRSQLFTVNVETGEERRVPFLDVNAQGPSWGPRRR
jgi:TolB protein